MKTKRRDFLKTGIASLAGISLAGKVDGWYGGVYRHIPGVALSGDLDDRFENPPESTRPCCYWYWLNGQISKENITKDLENMARVGIRLAMIGSVSFEGNSSRPVTGKQSLRRVETLSSEWWGMIRHAMSEGNRVGVDIYMFNSPGWSQSGGPWNKEEQSMRRVTWNEIETEGGTFSGRVRPEKLTPGQDIAVLALPRLDHVSVRGVENGDSCVFSCPEAFTARSLRVDGSILGKKGRLYAIRNG